MPNVLKALILASERAANVARSCCEGPVSERALVISEKGDEGNPRFEKDFKTIADVLAQESAKTEFVDHSSLYNSFRGEECSEIEGVRISLRDTVSETIELLEYLLPNKAASKMADAAHRNPNITFCSIPDDLPDFDCDDIGIWMDPIDGTNEFITGAKGITEADRGLSCVTVLIGAYLKSTGEPVVGVVNQPFAKNNQSLIVWGVNYKGTKLFGKEIPKPSDENCVLMSGAEKSEIKESFTNAGWKIVTVPGAGNKLLKVILGESPLYIVSQGTTFRWDTCGPHAILKAMGGDIISYADRKPITYNIPEQDDVQEYCNSDGIIAYSSEGALGKFDSVINK